jgi:hypothetical protein
MVEDALRGVLREALIVCQNGMPGDHHFYITFRTRHPDVDIADYIRARYPDEMTIVLQHQFWGLEVTPEWFEVTLSFNRINERLHIPFSAVTAFADPSVKFGLQFQADTAAEIELGDGTEVEPEATETVAEAKDDSEEERSEQGAQVITLDAFRKK